MRCRAHSQMNKQYKQDYSTTNIFLSNARASTHGRAVKAMNTKLVRRRHTHRSCAVREHCIAMRGGGKEVGETNQIVTTAVVATAATLLIIATINDTLCVTKPSFLPPLPVVLMSPPSFSPTANTAFPAAARICFIK